MDTTDGQLSKIELHYFFIDESHTIDALIRHNCEGEVLAIIKKIASVLDVEIEIQTEPFAEGGLKEIWKVVSKNKYLAGVVTGVLISVISHYLTIDKELNDLQKESLRLDIQKKKIELEKQKNEQPNNLIINIDDISLILNNNIKVIKHKSNFYKHLHSYKKVTKFSTNHLNENNVAIDNPVIIERKDFDKFILETDKLPTNIDEDAIIEIISPVLKRGNYQWHGIYNGKPIYFAMKHAEFKDSVIRQEVVFKNGTVIKGILETSRRIDDLGNEEITGYAVTTVIEYHDEEIIIETEKGKKFKQKKDADERQTKLFNGE